MNRGKGRNKSSVKKSRPGGATVQSNDSTTGTLTLQGVEKTTLPVDVDTVNVAIDLNIGQPEILVSEQIISTLAPPPPHWCSPKGEWQTIWEAVVGLAHRDKVPPMPCQDAAGAVNKPRPIILIADGAGSSAVSEIGARAVVTATLRLLDTIEHDVATLLDSTLVIDESSIGRFAKMVVKHAKGTLTDLADSERRSIQDFRCTFLFIILGKERMVWAKVGDGALVIEKIEVDINTITEDKLKLIPHLTTLGSTGKGEFANQTTFIDDKLSISDVQWGVCDARLITGAAVMSDGAAEKLVTQDGSRAASQLSLWLDALRHGKLRRRTLTTQFYDESFTKGTTLDDRSLALASAQVDVSELKAQSLINAGFS